LFLSTVWFHLPTCLNYIGYEHYASKKDRWVIYNIDRGHDIVSYNLDKSSSINTSKLLYQFRAHIFKDGFSLKIKNLHVHLHFIATQYKICPCGRYRQLNSILYTNYHILKSSKIIFNGLVVKDG